MIYDQGFNLKYIMIAYTSLCSILFLIGTFVLTPSLPTLFNWIREESRLLGYVACVQRGSIAVSDFVVKSLDWNNFESVAHVWVYFTIQQPAKLQKKQCGRVYFWLYGIAYWMPIQQKLPPPVLLFSDFAGWGLHIQQWNKIKT